MVMQRVRMEEPPRHTQIRLAAGRSITWSTSPRGEWRLRGRRQGDRPDKAFCVDAGTVAGKVDVPRRTREVARRRGRLHRAASRTGPSRHARPPGRPAGPSGARRLCPAAAAAQRRRDRPQHAARRFRVAAAVDGASQKTGRRCRSSIHPTRFSPGRQFDATASLGPTRAIDAVVRRSTGQAPADSSRLSTR